MPTRYTLPRWLYEALPSLYACAGLFTLLNLRSGLGLLSGLLLIGAGWQVWRMRYAYRRLHGQHRTTRVPSRHPAHKHRYRTSRVA